MKHFFIIVILLLCTVLFGSCGSVRNITLNEPIITQYYSLEGYKYVYITPTTDLTSSSGGVFGNQYGVYGSTQTKTINPCDLISGFFLKRGYIRLPELKSELADETLIVNYGESGRRNVKYGYTIEITVQIVSAKTTETIYIGTAEGFGQTEADDVRIAINRALSPLFE